MKEHKNTDLEKGAVCYNMAMNSLRVPETAMNFLELSSDFGYVKGTALLLYLHLKDDKWNGRKRDLMAFVKKVNEQNADNTIDKSVIEAIEKYIEKHRYNEDETISFDPSRQTIEEFTACCEKMMEEHPEFFSHEEDDEPVLDIRDCHKPGDKDFSIPFNMTIPIGFLDGCPEIERVIVNSDFDMDDDCASHFGQLHNLKEFVVNGPGPYFTRDGVLFYDTRIGGNDKNLVEEGFFGEARNLKGNILVAFPPGFPLSEYVIPEDVVGIAASAFANSKLEALYIPESLEITGCVAFYNMTSLKRVYVPNKEIDIICDDYEYANIDFELYPTKEDEILDDEVVMRWNDVRQREPMYSNRFTREDSDIMTYDDNNDPPF